MTGKLHFYALKFSYSFEISNENIQISKHSVATHIESFDLISKSLTMVNSLKFSFDIDNEIQVV